jgi:hypothetical protein
VGWKRWNSFFEISQVHLSTANVVQSRRNRPSPIQRYTPHPTYPFSPVWHLVDAKEKILGKLAQRISIALRGKYKPIYSPAVDHGDWVVVINARHVALTGKK